MSNVDISQLITVGDKAVAASETAILAVKAECSQRIYAVLDAPTVSNIQGAVLAGELDKAQMRVFRAGRTWVADMLATSRSLVAADADCRIDNFWPTIPEGLAELAAKF